MVNVRNFPCIDGIHEDHEIRLGKLNACMLNQKQHVLIMEASKLNKNTDDSNHYTLEDEHGTYKSPI